LVGENVRRLADLVLLAIGSDCEQREHHGLVIRYRHVRLNTYQVGCKKAYSKGVRSVREIVSGMSSLACIRELAIYDAIANNSRNRNPQHGLIYRRPTAATLVLLP
jgi:hypothetical protein